MAAAYKKEVPDMPELVRGFCFEDYTGTLLKDLSTGSRDKAFLIAAFALEPELLLLDETVNGPDFQSTGYLYQLIAGYKGHGTEILGSILCALAAVLAASVLYPLRLGRTDAYAFYAGRGSSPTAALPCGATCPAA